MQPGGVLVLSYIDFQADLSIHFTDLEAIVVLNSIAPEDLQEIEQERLNIRYSGRAELIERLCGIN